MVRFVIFWDRLSLLSLLLLKLWQVDLFCGCLDFNDWHIPRRSAGFAVAERRCDGLLVNEHVMLCWYIWQFLALYRHGLYAARGVASKPTKSKQLCFKAVSRWKTRIHARTHCKTAFTLHVNVLQKTLQNTTDHDLLIFPPTKHQKTSKD